MNKYFLYTASAILLVGCLKTRAELEAEKTGVVQERQTIAQQKVPAVKQAPPAPRGDELDEQLRDLNGRIETVENSVNQMRAAKQAEAETGSKDKQAFDKKFEAYEEALKKLEDQITALTEEVAKLKAPSPEPAAPAKGKNAYDDGEEQFAKKKWKEAIVDFQKYRDKNPKGKQYADATYKIGVSFAELGMKDEARAFLEEVTQKFPKSKEAKKAEQKLKSLDSKHK